MSLARSLGLDSYQVANAYTNLAATLAAIEGTRISLNYHRSPFALSFCIFATSFRVTAAL